ncbi:hypothetical protein MNBD_GAMMA12-2944 [hydrothermal vent metagenome]|uniref:DUF4124 domain-containing protein n=1 Tax=hydrothermal vent metagenome TaxID=652676 RepID=A0A3B0YLS7_9ZZZZ
MSIIKNWYHVLGLMLLGILLGSVYAAKVYQWTDKQGVIHYGDQPHYSDVKKISLDSAPPVDNDFIQRSKQRNQYLKNYNETKVVQEQKAKENSSEQSKKKIRCARANKLKNSYASASQLYQKDKAGKKIILSAQKKQAAMQEVKVYIDKWCQ